MRKDFLLLALVPFGGVLAWACASPTVFDQPDADAAPQSDAGLPLFGDAAPTEAGKCTPAEVLVVLDRSESMAAMPDGTMPPDTDAGLASTKWSQAVDAIYTVSTPPADHDISFGLELFPLDPDTMDGGYPDSGHCTTLEQIVIASQLGAGTKGKDSGLPTNTLCQPSQLLVTPALENGQAIHGAVDPLGTHLCYSTPIGVALENADQQLSSDTFAGDKYVVLITDGQETCKGDPLSATQKLATDHIKTFVVGFGLIGSNGVDAYALNNLACAGRTATDFANNCVLQGSGYVSIATTPVFYVAQNGPALTAALHAITGGVACDPVN